MGLQKDYKNKNKHYKDYKIETNIEYTILYNNIHDVCI